MLQWKNPFQGGEQELGFYSMGNELQLSNRQKTFFGVLVCLIIPLSGMSTDIYLPSLPAIAQHFQTGKSLS